MVPSTRRLGQLVSLRRFYVSLYDNNFPSLVASLFSWRCLAASTSFFIHATINLRPLSFYSPAMPNARTSLCAQSVYSFSFPTRPLRAASSKFPIHSLWQPAPAHSDERSCTQKKSRTQRCFDARTSNHLEGTVVRGHPMVWSLALCPEKCKARPGGIRCGVWSSVPGEGSTYYIHTVRLPRPLRFGF